MNKTLRNLLLLLLIAVIGYLLYRQFAHKPTTSPVQGITGAFDYLPGNSKGVLIKHKAYILSYREEYEQAEWVAYELTKSELNDVTGREDNFTEDPDVATGSALSSDYSRSGYDRGHLAPSADMRYESRVQKESFYMSNIAPQSAELNRGVWKDLEEAVRRWVKQYDTLYIVTGGVLQPGLEYIGKKNKIAVPNEFYKIIFDKHRMVMKAFLIPNNNPGPDFNDYRVTVDSVEKVTGLDFFPALPDSIENIIEAKIGE